MPSPRLVPGDMTRLWGPGQACSDKGLVSRGRAGWMVLFFQILPKFRKMASTTEKCESVQTTINYFDDPGVPLVPMVIGG